MYTDRKTVYEAKGVNNGLSPVICDFETVNTTALKLVTTKLGLCACDENGRGQRVQLAEMEVGNIIRGEVTEGSVNITADGADEIIINSYDELYALIAEVEASTYGGEGLIWTIEDEQGFVADFAELYNMTNTGASVSAYADGSAYVVARFSNGLNTFDKLPITVKWEEQPEEPEVNPDEEAAAAVDSLIEAIGEVTLEDEAAIVAARAAYEALTDAQKALVTKLEVLAEAEAALEILKTPVETAVVISVSGDETVMVDDEEITFTVSAAKTNALATASITLELDTTVMGEATAVGVGNWYVIGQNYNNGKLIVVVGNNTGSTSEEAEALFTVTAKLTGETGDASVTVTNAKLSAYDGEGEKYVEGTIEGASIITKVEFKLYDVNKDGIVDQLDITRAQRFYGLTEEADGWYARADVNGDKVVDIEDLILIANNFDDKDF